MSTHGFPEWAVRYLERKAEEQGVFLHVDALRLDPAHGLVMKAEGVKLYSENHQTLASVGSVSLGLSLSHLLVGEIQPSLLKIKSGEVTLPVTEPAGKSLGVRDINLDIDETADGILRVTHGTMSVQGVPLQIGGSVNIAGLKEAALNSRANRKHAEDEKHGILTQLAAHQSVINRIYSIIEQQRWEENKNSRINITLRPEDKPCIELDAEINRVDVERFNFRDIVLNARYSNDQIVISNFSFVTVDPDTSVTFKGGYDLDKQRLSFELFSNADLLDMVKYVPDEKSKLLLSKFRFPEDKYPTIKIKGDITFDDLSKGYSPDSAFLDGSVTQNEILIDGILLNDICLEFRYNNGEFSINKFKFDLPQEGYVKMTASARRAEGDSESRRGRGSLDLDAHLPVETTLQLLRTLGVEKAELPEMFTCRPRVDVELEADLEMLVFKPGDMRWQEFMPEVRNVRRLSVSAQELEYRIPAAEEDGKKPVAYDTLRLRGAKLTLIAEGIRQNSKLVPDSVSKVSLALEADEVSYADATSHTLTTGKAPGIRLALADLATLSNPDMMFERLISGTTVLAVSIGGISSDGSNAFSTGAVGAAAQCSEWSIHGSFAKDSLCIQNLKTQEACVNEVQLGALAAEKLILNPVELPPVNSLSDLEECWKSLHIQAGIVKMSLPEPQAEEADAELAMDDAQEPPAVASRTDYGDLILKIDTGGDAPPGATDALGYGKLSLGHVENRLTPEQFASGLSFSFVVSDAQHIAIDDLEATIYENALKLAASAAAVKLPYIELPAEVQILNGQARLNLEEEADACMTTRFRLNVPSIVRTPYKQAPLKGKKVELGISGGVELMLKTWSSAPVFEVPDLRIEERRVIVPGNVAIGTKKNLPGRFEGSIDGREPGCVVVRGFITMRPDVVDLLLDSRDAHSIIGDFKFSDASSTLVSNIETVVKYRNDILDVTSDCDALIENSAFLLSTDETNNSGKAHKKNSKLRPGEDNHTWLHKATTHVHVRVVEGISDVTMKTVPKVGAVTLTNVRMVYNNRPWLQREKLDGGVYESILDADKIVIDIENSFVSLDNVRGKAYPSYSLGMFYTPLYELLDDVYLPLPVELNAYRCLFPIYSECKEPMSGTIRVISPREAKFRFLGTKIPLDDFSGFVYLTDHYVQLDRMNAKTWGGVLNASVRIGISGGTSFKGYASAECMNLKDIAADYKNKQEDAIVNADVYFTASSPNVKSLKAHGSAEVINGNLMPLDIFRPLSELISDLPGQYNRLQGEIATATGRPAPKPGFINRNLSILFKWLGDAGSSFVSRITSDVPGANHLIAYDLQDAKATYKIADGHLITQKMDASGYNVDVEMDLDINLNTLQINGRLKPRLSGLPELLLAPLTFISSYVVDIGIYGKLGDIKWKMGLAGRQPSEPPCAVSEPDKKRKPKKAAASH